MGIPEEDEDESYYGSDVFVESKDGAHEEVLCSITNGSNVHATKVKSRRESPQIFSPMDSPKTSPKTSSPKLDMYGKKESTSMLRLLSCRAVGAMDSTISAYLPAAFPFRGHESSTSSADSDGEMTVCFKAIIYLLLLFQLL